MTVFRGALCLFFAHLFGSFIIQVYSKEQYIKAVSIFRPDEVDMHKYSAILAATEPFRYQCEAQIKTSVSPVKRVFMKLNGSTLNCLSSLVAICMIV